jgi:hypothetical protein
LKFHFPDIYQTIEDGSADLLHIVMGNFRIVVEENLSLREKITHQYFDFLSKVLDRADDDLINAIELSFLYGFPQNRENIETAANWMPENLKRAKKDLRKKLSN